MNAALWRSDNKSGTAKYLRDKRVPVPPSTPQISREMGWAYFGFVAGHVELGRVFHRVVCLSVSIWLIIPPLFHTDSIFEAALNDKLVQPSEVPTKETL